MRIGPVDLASRVLVIAEIGVNHDGSVERALDMVRAAADAGADAVKVQVFVAERLMHKSARFAEYQVGRTDASDPVAMLKQYELDDAALARIAAEATKRGLMTIATPFSPEDVPRVVAMGAAALKIASPDIVNALLLHHACETRLPMIVSTGAATAEEIDSAVRWLKPRCASLVVLHCISSYPTSADEANLRWIVDLSRFGVPVGYSDHTDQLFAGAMAVSAGARIVEKHLTYDTTAAGPDHSASFDGEQFEEYVGLIRIAERMLGSPGRVVLDCEKDVRVVSRQGLVLTRDVRAGETVTLEDLTTQRPGDGVSPELLAAHVGMKVRQDMPAGSMVGKAARG